MLIEYKGKTYDTETWHKDYLEKLFKVDLGKTTTEKKKLQSLNDLSFGKRIIELTQDEQDIQYKLDQLQGKGNI